MEFRRRTLLPLDDVMGCLRESIPKLSRSSLHRCLLRHGISRLPASEIKASGRGKFAPTEIGYVHIDIAELRLAQGKLNMFLAIDRVSKFTCGEFRDDMGKMNGAEFLRGVINTFPYKIHTVLTDNGMAFADLPKNRNKPIHAFLGMHIFGRVCNENGITHKLTKPYHPWTNGQAERMNRTIKEATIKAFHYPDLESLRAHVHAFVCAFNFARHLKALRWKTPYQTVVEAWQKIQLYSKPTLVTSSRDHTRAVQTNVAASEPGRAEVSAVAQSKETCGEQSEEVATADQDENRALVRDAYEQAEVSADQEFELSKEYDAEPGTDEFLDQLSRDMAKPNADLPKVIRKALAKVNGIAAIADDSRTTDTEDNQRFSRRTSNAAPTQAQGLLRPVGELDADSQSAIDSLVADAARNGDTLDITLGFLLDSVLARGCADAGRDSTPEVVARLKIGKAAQRVFPTWPCEVISCGWCFGGKPSRT